MYLENLVVDANEPQRLGRFWEAVLGSERLSGVPVSIRLVGQRVLRAASAVVRNGSLAPRTPAVAVAQTM
jgi:hypothetical protein